MKLKNVTRNVIASSLMQILSTALRNRSPWEKIEKHPEIPITFGKEFTISSSDILITLYLGVGEAVAMTTKPPKTHRGRLIANLESCYIIEKRSSPPTDSATALLFKYTIY